LETVVQGLQGVALRQVPCCVEGSFVAAFAEHDSDVSGCELAGEGAVVQGLEEGWVYEGAVACWAELVQFDAGCCVEQGLGWDRAETGQFFIPGQRPGDLEGGEKLVELKLRCCFIFGLNAGRV
jgi:hypothetical protein